MDFFARQDNARKQTGILLIYFGAAVATTILLVYLLPILVWNFFQSRYGSQQPPQPLHWWHPDIFVLVCGITLIVVLCGALFKISQLRRGGGEGVAVMLGGRQIYPDTSDFFEKRLRNVVEEMAIASGVQFTRNSAGLAGALKKIGGLSYGSRIVSPNAAQASHMFFGNGVRSSIFSTHPPLAQRVQWLEPTFDGNFPTVTHKDLREQLARFEGAPLKKEDKKPDIVDLFTDPTKLAVTATILEATSQPHFKPNNPEALIASIGQPMQHHAGAAKQLIDSIPERVKEHARDPYGARMLIYFLLLDSDEAVRGKQMAIIKESAEPEVYQALEQAIPNLDKIKPEMRLPIIDLSIPALRFLSPGQYAAFRTIVKQLIYADDRVALFEYALQRVLVRHLDPTFSGKTKRRPVNYYAIRGLEKETSTILSALARNGHEDPAEVKAAFQYATGKITSPKTSFELLPEEKSTWEDFDAALDKFAESSFKVKKWLLGSALACLMHDREITIAEVELFRAIADSLDCPAPPWVSPTELDII